MKSKWLDRGGATPLPYYCLCMTEQDLEYELRMLKVPKEDRPTFMASPRADATTHLFYKLPKRVAIVTMDWRKAAKHSPIVVAGLLVHEAVHVWQFHVHNLREESPGEEQEAYSVQWMSQQLMWSYVEQTKRRKR